MATLRVQPSSWTWSELLTVIATLGLCATLSTRAGAAEKNKVTSIVLPPPAAVDFLVEEGLAPSFLDLVEIVPPDAPEGPLPANLNLLALLVDFSDKTATVTGNLTAIDNLIFAGQVVGRGSVRDYFADVSFGQVDFVTLDLPSAVGWTRAPQTYAHYVNGLGCMTGAYPRNCGRMVEDLVSLVNPIVDFSQYDNDGDGFVDTLLVIHAGTGAEWSTSMNDMWAHASTITNMGGTAPTVDGVTVDSYFIAPEYLEPGGVSPTSTDMTIGVICHEIGHGFWGLPDLYDLDLSSAGIGTWGLMSYGDWNGPAKFNSYRGFSMTDGSSPALPSAWSRVQMGIEVPLLVNTTGQLCLVPSESLPGGIARIESVLVGGPPDEYFLLENRQRFALPPAGYDDFIPASGLLIWHIDEQRWSRYGGSDNNWECRSRPTPHCWGTCANGFPYWHYLVSLEQADGFDNLEMNSNPLNKGDTGDPFPGLTGNTAWQPWQVNQRNPESGSWFDTLCSVSTQIELTGINILPPTGGLLACMNVVQPGTGIFQDSFDSGNTSAWSTVVP